MGLFDEAIRRLKQLQGTTVTIPYETDEKGYWDRECPAPDCLFQFKVLATDWKLLFRDEQVFCPLCRHEAPAKHWNTTEQVEQSHGQLKSYVAGVLNEALRKGAEEANREWATNTWMRIDVSFTGSAKQHVFVPIAAKEAVTLEIACNQCSAHYAVIGSAFFCPNCGHNSAEQTFGDALRKIGAKLDNLALIKQAFVDIKQVDEGELITRSLVETALSDCVSALQRLCEELFRRHFPAEKAPFNIFQRLDDANALWHRKVGVGYDDWLTEEQFQEMKMLYQRRHLLAHSEGMVDDQYIQRSLDADYKTGQRLVIKEKDARKLIAYVSIIAQQLKSSLAP